MRGMCSSGQERLATIWKRSAFFGRITMAAPGRISIGTSAYRNLKYLSWNFETPAVIDAINTGGKHCSLLQELA
jgi:hypothetical protein